MVFMMWKRSGNYEGPLHVVTRDVVPGETPHLRQLLEVSLDPKEAQWALMQNQQGRQVRPTVVSRDVDLIQPPFSPHRKSRAVNPSYGTKEDDNGPENTQRGHSQRVINRQIMKSSLKVRHQVQDALDTAKAAELALREMISSWRAVK